MVYKIGITGGIASGKSHCLKFLSTLECPRVYAMNLDLMAAKIYGLNPYVLEDVASIFGEDTVIRCQSNKMPIAVNRVPLAQKVFSNDHNLAILRSIISPEIKKLML